MTAFEKTVEALRKAERVAIFCHTRPDPDTLGSGIALREALISSGKEADIYCDTTLMGRLSFLSGYENISTEFRGKYDLHIALDCGDGLRLGELGGVFFRCKNNFNVDHHYLTNDNFAAVNWVENRASAAQMTYDIIKALGAEITDNIASAIMSGIVTDTNAFTNTNTDKAVLTTAAELIGRVDINFINFRLRRNTSYRRIKLLGRALNGIRLYSGGKIAVMTVRERDLEEEGAVFADTDGFADNILDIDGIKAAVCISESSKNTFKIGMRGKDGTDVCSVCRFFGGGGHKVAAGCTICGFYEDVIDRILRAFDIELGFGR